MKITILLEGLGSGGAERQACIIAKEMKKRSHDVVVVTYAAGDYFKYLLEKENIEIVYLEAGHRLSRMAKVRKYLRQNNQDVVLTFLSGPAVYAELAGIPKRRWKLIVSERTSIRGRNYFIKYLLHSLSDSIVTNSHANRFQLVNSRLVARRKIFTIYNAVNDLENEVRKEKENHHDGRIVFLVAARIIKEKNVLGLLKALKEYIDERGDSGILIRWYGNQKIDRRYYLKALSERASLGLDNTIEFLPPTREIFAQMMRADAVLLPSFIEGLPNSVCEGMTLAKPILLSDVCDARYLVENGVNGFLFDPGSPTSIAAAIKKFVDSPMKLRLEMGKNSYHKSRELFAVDSVCDQYLNIMRAGIETMGEKAE